ncbi:hypothetical protein HOU02_gp097 [Caulobacter phage CcrBL9]|uniref:Uncharacterized protein n=1 Tax=Caulobacter phage CcrBL9 TaxID=2283270 RepID=A0A385EB46_9CAUD|nr:hypothetical protein HOU02_gp097 [Caulobacter phage CcrBL9]AXQ69121.1 hypothetical protein CcrBL9_gp097 [Caulobacter phage CcrBL9]
MLSQPLRIKASDKTWQAEHAGALLSSVTNLELTLKAGEVPSVTLTLDTLAGGTNFLAEARWRPIKVNRALRLAQVYGKAIAVAQQQPILRQVEVINTGGAASDWMVRYLDRTATPPLHKVKVSVRGNPPIVIADLWVQEDIIDHVDDAALRRHFSFDFVTELLGANYQELVDAL